ncbi:MAG: ribosomal protein S18-alanine N-acetyltransferase [Piscirickettsiaceae bacterium]|nr:ribosomal protein S18-alanine N-acetyltransferase [Piscirickettsiaceae bacterium]
MQQSDLAEVVNIEQLANQFPWSRKNFEGCLKSKHQAWVFVDESKDIQGYAIVQKVVDEAHLLNICVKPSAQKQGLGRKILNHIIDYSNSISSVLIVLEVRSSNKRAQQLYISAGFNEMSVRKNYYPAKQGREDAVLMGLDLDLMFFFSDE